MLEYDTLEIRLARDGGRGHAVVAHAPAGSADGFFALPCPGESLERFPPRLAGGEAGPSGFETTVAHDARRFGTALFAALFDQDVGELYRRSRARADEHHKALRITLSMDGTPELAAVPWEYLFDDPEFLALSAWTPVVRRLEVPNQRSPAQIEPPLRILGMLSSPSDQEPLDAVREREGLERALADLVREGLVELQWCETATLSELHDRLEAADVHVFHYVGHGSYHPAADDGVLYLEGNEASEPVAARRLGAILGEEHDLRLTVLNACEGARGSRADPFAGVAAGLVRRNMPAVVGMQSKITMDAARLFTEHFYRALARGHAVDAAVAKGRLGVYASGNEVEWAAPVLLLQVPDGRIFDLEWKDDKHAPLALPPAVDAILTSLYEAIPEPPVVQPVEGALELPATSNVETAGVLRKTGAAAPVGAEFYATVDTDKRSQTIVIGHVENMGPEQAIVVHTAEGVAAATAREGATPSAVLAAVDRAITLAAPPEGSWSTIAARVRDEELTPEIELAWRESPTTRGVWPSVLLLTEDDVLEIAAQRERRLLLSAGQTLALCFNTARTPLQRRDPSASAQQVADFIAHSTDRDERDERETACVIVVRAPASPRSRPISNAPEDLPEGVVVFAPAGEIDLYTSPELKRQVSDLFEGDLRALVIDMSDVTFIDSPGLSVLTSVLKRCRHKEVPLRIVLGDANEDVWWLFDALGLDKLFEVHPTREDALDSLPDLGPPASPQPTRAFQPKVRWSSATSASTSAHRWTFKPR